MTEQRTAYLTLEETLVLHEELIARFGGSIGVRDMGMVHAGLHRPMSGYYATLAAQAGALFQSFACNHPFVDGNKRVAFAVTAVFLRLNGYRLVVSADDAERFLIDQIIGAKASVDEIATWLEKHMQR